MATRLAYNTLPYFYSVTLKYNKIFNWTLEIFDTSLIVGDLTLIEDATCDLFSAFSMVKHLSVLLLTVTTKLHLEFIIMLI